MNYNKQRLPERQETAAPVRGSFDIPFFALTLLLLTIGVIMVLSASFPRAYYQGKSPMYYFLRQGLFAAAGVCFMIVFSKINMAVYRRFSFWVLAVSVLLLMVVPIIGTSGGGAGRRRAYRATTTATAISSISRHTIATNRLVILRFTKLLMILQTRTCNNHYVDNAKNIIPSMFCIKDIHCTIV